jgi:hypothetical protein
MVAALGVRAEPVSEACVGSMDVEDPKLAIARVPKAVEHSDRYRHPRSNTREDYLIAERELSLSLEDIKRNPRGLGVYAGSR